MKIERVVVYNPTIHYGYLLEKNRHPGRRQGHERKPHRWCHANQVEVYAVTYLLINIVFI